MTKCPICGSPKFDLIHIKDEPNLELHCPNGHHLEIKEAYREIIYDDQYQKIKSDWHDIT